VPEEIFANARVFLACLESPIETVERGLRRARAAGLTTILNPAPAGPLVGHLEILKLVDVLTPNAGEAALLLGMPANEQAANETTSQAAGKLRRHGARSVVVTQGSAGALVVEETTEHVPAVKATPLDTTAAGDAFNGALAVAFSEGRSLIDAVRWATCAAAISVTREGAQPSLATRAEIESSFASNIET